MIEKRIIRFASETFRTPSYADFYFLENINYEDPYFDWVDTRDGIKGIRFKDSEFFLPWTIPLCIMT